MNNRKRFFFLLRQKSPNLPSAHTNAPVKKSEAIRRKSDYATLTNVRKTVELRRKCVAS